MAPSAKPPMWQLMPAALLLLSSVNGCRSDTATVLTQPAAATAVSDAIDAGVGRSNNRSSTGTQFPANVRLASQTVEPRANQSLPIDLPTALRLGNANNLEIALARERVAAATARLQEADVLWLPNLTAGTTYLRHDGQIQQSVGTIIDARRSSLFVGGGPALIGDVADMIYEPLVAAQVVRAEQAAADVAANDNLLRIAEAYLDLLAAQASVEIARLTFDDADKLAKVTQEFADEGAGLPSDAARTQTERGSREQQKVAAHERLIIASAQLAQLIRLDPQVQLVPLDTNVVTIELVPENRTLADLVAHALSNRPELAEQHAIVHASIERLRQAKYGPLLPSVLLGYSAGGFGGGQGDFFGDFDGREDFTAAAVWELRNLGLGDRARRRLRESELNQAQIKSLAIADRIATEVVAAEQLVESRRQQVEITRRTVESATRSLELNLTRIRRGAGLPIEALQAIQALDRERTEYLRAVISYDKAQFRLFTALGNRPIAPEDSTSAQSDHPRENDFGQAAVGEGKP